MLVGLVILFILIGISTYLVILGGSKTEEEQKLEDEEQTRYLENYKNRRK